MCSSDLYKGLKPVLWCTQDQTALAEAEVEYDNHTSPSVYVKFPVVTSPSVLSKTFSGVSFPDGIKLVSVDPHSGLRSSGAGSILEAFKPGTAPPDSFSGGDGEGGANQMNSSHVDQSVGSGTGGLY